MPLFFSYSNTLIQSHSRSVTQIPFPVSRHLLNFKISTETTTAWCHPTSTVAVTTASTAVCEHRLTPRLEDPCTDPPPPLPIQPPLRSLRRSAMLPLALVPVSGTSVWAARPQYDTDPPPVKPISPQPRSQSWILLPDWMFLFGYEPSYDSFHSRAFGHRDPVSGGRRFRGSWWFFGIFEIHLTSASLSFSALTVDFLYIRVQSSAVCFDLKLTVEVFFFSPFVDINVNCFEGR